MEKHIRVRARHVGPHQCRPFGTRKLVLWSAYRGLTATATQSRRCAAEGVRYSAAGRHTECAYYLSAVRSAAWAAKEPQRPWTPGPGGVEEEQRKMERLGLVWRREVGRRKVCRRVM